MIPPKPPTRPDTASFLRYVTLFRKDALSAHPAKLYRAWMASFKTPFFRSYLCNDPKLVDLILKERPEDFPKSDRTRAGLSLLLGNSVFLTNSETWKRQRRIIDLAFEGGRLRESIGAMTQAANAAVARMPLGVVEIEEQASHAAADVIFHTLFSLPIENEIASEVFSKFREFQRSQPLLNLAAFLPLPRWFPRFHRKKSRESAKMIRKLITQLCYDREKEIAQGAAPTDLSTKLMTVKDPVTGTGFDTDEMVDQVAIFFLAGHETSASSMAWALYMLALFPDIQERVAKEVANLPPDPDLSALSQLRLTRDVFREVLRLYPPVPMMVRQNTCPENFRGQDVAPGGQVVVSMWHLHRHQRLWDKPDHFDPDRWTRAECKASARAAYIPFSAGPRVCVGASFAMSEGTLLLAKYIQAFRFELSDHPPAEPIAYLTVRSKNGIFLKVSPRHKVE